MTKISNNRIPQFLQNDLDRLDKYLSGRTGDHVAVFDIGTRAARLLVGPKKVPSYWVKGEFFSAGYPFMLGRDIDQSTRTMDLNSVSLSKVINMMAILNTALRQRNITDVDAIGTAVFRWLANRAEVLNHIQKQTGLRIDDITGPMEAELTLRSVWSVLEKTEGRARKIGDNDYIAVVDQGGGSIEVSWMRWADRLKARPKIESARSDNLGTIALLNEFLSRGGKGQLVDPSENRARISTQTNRVRTFARETITSWKTLIRQDDVPGGEVHLFGIGTALTKLANVSSFNGHGRFVDLDRMEREVADRAAVYDGSNQLVMTLYKALNGESTDRTQLLDISDLSEDLTIMYGIPAFLEVTKAIGLTGISVFGFGLRFGYYLWKYEKREPLPFIPSDESGPYTFVSYARKNALPVYREMHELHRRGYRMAYDAGIAPSEDYRSAIARMLKRCTSVVVYWTKESVASDEVRLEILFAVRKKIPIIQVFLEPLELPDDLELAIGWQQYVSRYEQSFDRYIELITSALPESTKILASSDRRT